LDLSGLKTQVAEDGGKIRKYKTFKELLNYLKETGRDSQEDYDLEAAYNDDDTYFDWQREEEKNPGQGHWRDTYKKSSHITFSNESKYSNKDAEGGVWAEINGDEVFIPSEYNLKNYKLTDYLKHGINVIIDGQLYKPKKK